MRCIADRCACFGVRACIHRDDRVMERLMLIMVGHQVAATQLYTASMSFIMHASQHHVDIKLQPAGQGLLLSSPSRMMMDINKQYRYEHDV